MANGKQGIPQVRISTKFRDPKADLSLLSCCRTYDVATDNGIVKETYSIRFKVHSADLRRFSATFADMQDTRARDRFGHSR